MNTKPKRNKYRNALVCKNEVKWIAMARIKQYMIFEKLRECGIEELKIKEESLFDL